MAVVLLDEDTFELSGDYANDCCSLALAFAE
jgi:hypothetical protein